MVMSVGISENDRLKELQRVLGFTSQDNFAKALGIKQGSLSDIYRCKGGVGVSGSIKRILEKEYFINIEWLESGIGEIKSIGTNTNKENSITISSEVWSVISNQAASLAEKDKQTSRLIDILERQLKHHTTKARAECRAEVNVGGEKIIEEDNK